MKRVLSSTLLCLCLLILPCVASADPPDKTIRVLTYNIHHGEGGDGKLDLNRIAKIIQSSKADIVLLQEVDAKTRRALGVDQPQALAQLTGMHVAFGANIRYDGGEFGNAILSRYPILSSTNHRLPNVVPSEARGALCVKIQLPEAMSSMTCRVLATHWDHGKDEQNRLASADALKQLATDWQEPVILGGDLNATPEAESIQRFAAQWHMVGTSELLTFPAERPSKQIDFVAFRAQPKFHVHEVRILDEPVASDHRPLLVTLEVR